MEGGFQRNRWKIVKQLNQELVLMMLGEKKYERVYHLGTITDCGMPSGGTMV